MSIILINLYFTRFIHCHKYSEERCYCIQNKQTCTDTFIAAKVDIRGIPGIIGEKVELWLEAATETIRFILLIYISLIKFSFHLEFV